MLNELKLIAKVGYGYKNMSKDDVTKILSELKTSISEERIKDIRKNFNKSRDRFLNPKNKKNIEKNLLRNRKQKRISVMIVMYNIGYICKL